jgi:protein TonB
MTIAAETRRELQRWLLSGAIVLMAHGGFAAGLIHWRDLDEPDDPAAAIVIDLAPMLVAPANISEEIPPGPEQIQAEATPEKPVEKVEEKPEEKVETAVDPEIVIAAVPPKPEPPTPPDNQQPAPVTTAPHVPTANQGPVAAAPTQGKLNLTNSNAIPTWTRQVVALLERNKRYPAAAGGAQGTAQVAFSLDRQGRVLATRIVKSSGSAALDQEALEWPKRAQPFPPPPPEKPGETIPLTVPYRFNVR